MLRRSMDIPSFKQSSIIGYLGFSILFYIEVYIPEHLT